MRSRWLSAAAITLIVGVFAHDWLTSSRSAKSASAAESAELQALRRETQRLQATVDALARTQRGDAHASSRPAAMPSEIAARLAGPAAQAPAPGELPSTPVLTAEQERASTLEYARFLDDALAAQPVDEDAAASLRLKLDEVMDERGSLLELQCNEALCRAKTRHADGQAYRAFQDSAFKGTALWPGPATMVILEDPETTPGGTLLAALYFARGESLPSPDPAH